MYWRVVSMAFLDRDGVWLEVSKVNRYLWGRGIDSQNHGVSQLFQGGSLQINRLGSLIHMFCFKLCISFYSVNSVSRERAGYYLLPFPRCVMLIHSWSSSAWQSSAHLLEIALRLRPSWMVFGGINSPKDSPLCNTNDGPVQLKLLCFSPSGYLPALLHLQPIICDLVCVWTAPGCQLEQFIKYVHLGGDKLGRGWNRGLIFARPTYRLPRNLSQHFLSCHASLSVCLSSSVYPSCFSTTGNSLWGMFFVRSPARRRA